jgi:hypothetical protein
MFHLRSNGDFSTFHLLDLHDVVSSKTGPFLTYLCKENSKETGYKCKGRSKIFLQYHMESHLKVHNNDLRVIRNKLSTQCQNLLDPDVSFDQTVFLFRTHSLEEPTSCDSLRPTPNVSHSRGIACYGVQISCRLILGGGRVVFPPFSNGKL